MVTQQQLDAIAAQAVQLFEFRLLVNRDVPESVHRTIRNVGAKLRDDIATHHPISQARVAERVIEDWNKETARVMGIL